MEKLYIGTNLISMKFVRGLPIKIAKKNISHKIIVKIHLHRIDKLLLFINR